MVNCYYASNMVRHFRRAYECSDLAALSELLLLIHNIKYSGFGKPSCVNRIGKVEIRTEPGERWPGVEVIIKGSRTAIDIFDAEIKKLEERN